MFTPKLNLTFNGTQTKAQTNPENGHKHNSPAGACKDYYCLNATEEKTEQPLFRLGAGAELWELTDVSLTWLKVSV